MKNWMEQEWSTEHYQEEKLKNFNAIDKVLKKEPKTILDIGCGLAWESRLFNKKYHSKLYLIEGDSNKNQHKPVLARDKNFNNTSENFLYYHTLDELDKKLQELGTKNYKLLDCENINIDNDIKFDLITSYVSCGFHYPVSEYRDLILNHSTSETMIIMDIRKSHIDYEKEIFNIKEVLIERKKFLTCQIEMVQDR